MFDDSTNMCNIDGTLIPYSVCRTFLMDDVLWKIVSYMDSDGMELDLKAFCESKDLSVVYVYKLMFNVNELYEKFNGNLLDKCLLCACEHKRKCSDLCYLKFGCSECFACHEIEDGCTTVIKRFNKY
jgi:hypothetical protein